ncbi:MAG: hypothetical protein EB103_04875 [Actinobacteria bacterium]|nr:hypothetical protein [Actinomycetota bacterium]
MISPDSGAKTKSAIAPARSIPRWPEEYSLVGARYWLTIKVFAIGACQVSSWLPIWPSARVKIAKITFMG